MMKKSIFFTLLSVISIALLAACGGSDPAPAAPPVQDTQEAAAPAAQEEPAPADEADDEADAEHTNPVFMLLDEHFPGTDLGGAVVRVNGLGDPGSDDPFIMQRDAESIAYVEQKFNITLELGALAGVDWNDVPDFIIASVAAGDPALHIFAGANAAYWFPPLANQGILVEGGPWVANNFPESWWRFHSEFQGRIYGFARGPDSAWSILGYNRDLIRAVGMEYTPSEMFVQGRWSLNDFYLYLNQLNTLLPPDVTPIGLHVTNWQRGAAFANGGYFKNPVTNAPGYLEEAFLEPARIMQSLIQNNIHTMPGFITEEEGGPPGGQWAFGAAMGDMMGMFRNGELAMTFVNSWNFYDLSAHIEFGVVPFPWGSNVTFPDTGDWRDLKRFNAGVYSSFSNDASTTLLIRGAPAGLDHEVMANIVFSFDTGAGEALITARERMEQGLPQDFTGGGAHDLFTDLDRELWNWYAEDPGWEPLDAVGTPAIFYITWANAMATGADLRASLEAIIHEDVWAMYQAGRIRLEDVPESVRVQAEEFGVMLAAEPDEEDDDEE